MSYMTINNRRVEFTNEKNVLSIIRKSGIDLPTFCYHSELSTYGACRMCVVEDDRGKIFASCSETPKRWNGNIYEHAASTASQKDDYRTSAGFPLSGLYDLCKKWDLYAAEAV